MKEKKLLWSLAIAIFLLSAGSVGTVFAAVTGACVNCHTMHNSQGGEQMATFGSETGANDALVRGSCLGCHGQVPGGANNIITEIPQVLHKDTDDLAGGNFSYILTGGKTRVTGNQNSVGHNVIDLGQNETVLTAPPGEGIATSISNSDFTCGGTKGCHGDRSTVGSFAAISGAHHGGVGGVCDTADTVANSYRFLLGVKGYENMDATYKYQNYNSAYHNEYYGATAGAETDSITVPANNTISGLCAECHGNYHGTDDIGGASSPFERHPTDIVLPNTEGKEYSAYTSYSVEAPVARPSVYTSISNSVAPGTDIVMCLSCHGAHATAYEDILRWDYTQMLAGGGGTNDGGGCFVCHTTKD